MAVIQISKIQVRRGLQQDLPQLSSAELAWSIDQQRLFIGNGLLSEGAPNIGNTEVLTEYTDILNVIKTYYFKGEESGYISQTSSSSLFPISRSLQDKLDEHVSVRDFGATGDGVTDDTDAIVRAIEQVYPVSQYSNPKIRRTLYFPAGVYLISSELSIPSYAILLGDGIRSTVIQQVNSSARSTLTFCDSSGQISPNIGLYSSVVPQFVTLSNLSLSNATDNDVVYLDSSNNIKFDRVSLIGAATSPTTSGTSKALLRLISTSSASYNIALTNCYFNNASYIVIASDNVYGVSIDGSYINTVYQGVKLSGSTYYPRSVRVFNSIFDNVANSAIASYGYSSIISGYNYYRSVGNGLSSSPVSPVIYYENPENYSIADIFDRTAAQDIVQPKIKSIGNFGATPSTSSLNSSGSLRYTPGATDVIAQNSTLANTSLVMSTLSSNNAIIDYTLTNGANVKTGTITLAINSLATNQFDFEDSFTEYPASAYYNYGINSPTATQLNFVTYGTTLVLTANTSATSGNVTFKYNIRQFK